VCLPCSPLPAPGALGREHAGRIVTIVACPARRCNKADTRSFEVTRALFGCRNDRRGGVERRVVQLPFEGPDGEPAATVGTRPGLISASPYQLDTTLDTSRCARARQRLKSGLDREADARTRTGDPFITSELPAPRPSSVRLTFRCKRDRVEQARREVASGCFGQFCCPQRCPRFAPPS
jgi:hypothetical protein